MNEQFYENINVLNSLEIDGFKVEVLEYKELKGSRNPLIAEDMYYVQKAGMSMKQVKVTLKDSGVVIEPGALYFHKGNIECRSNIGGVSGLAKKMIKSKLTNESTFNPMYSGTGELFLEPSFSHFIIVELNDDAIIVDKGVFYCCQEGLEVGVAMQKTISSALKGGEGLFQTRISGTGACVLEIPVPMSEILKVQLNNEKLQVDGNFALLRSDSITYSVQRGSGGIVDKLTSGEGLLQTFEGTGSVWLAPTQPAYRYILNNRIGKLASSTHNMNNPTENP